MVVLGEKVKRGHRLLSSWRVEPGLSDAGGRQASRLRSAPIGFVRGFASAVMQERTWRKRRDWRACHSARHQNLVRVRLAAVDGQHGDLARLQVTS